jgi:hypothetical protein
MDNEEGHMDAETAHQEPAIFIGDVAPGPARFYMWKNIK